MVPVESPELTESNDGPVFAVPLTCGERQSQIFSLVPTNNTIPSHHLEFRGRDLVKS